MPLFQVSLSSVCRGHVLLLRRDDLCGGGHLGSLQQDHAAVLHPTSRQLHLLATSALSLLTLPKAPPATVRIPITSSIISSFTSYPAQGTACHGTYTHYLQYNQLFHFLPCPRHRLPRYVLYTALIWSTKNFTLQPCWRIFGLLKICVFEYSNLTKFKAVFYLKGVILALSWGARK